MLTELFARAGLNKQDVQVIGFGAGPGSFTGVRIAASVTQGLALASASKVVAMKGSEILVRSAAGRTIPWTVIPQAVRRQIGLAVIPSRADAYYVSLYQQIDAELSVLIEDQLMLEASDWIEALAQDITAQGKNTLKIIGAMPDWMPGALTSAFVGTPVPDARVMISQVRQLYANGSAQGVEYALPIYVEGDSPWREKFLIEQAENLLRLPARPETPIVLMYTNDQRHRAEIYTEWCELRQVEEPMPVDVPSLYLDYQGIALCSPGNKRPFRLAEQNLHRRSVGARKGELARACGLNHGDLSILDACAGFGTDGLTLSMLGCPVNSS